MSFLEKAKKKIGELAEAAKGAVKGADEKPADVAERVKAAGEDAAAGTSGATLDHVKSRQGVLSRIQDIFTLGYSTKEDLRELDKALRESYYSDFTAMRHRWEEIYLAALNAAVDNRGDYKKVIQVMDRVAEKINRADYGYAGLMDRKGHVREDELAKVVDYDKALGAQVHGLEQAVADLHGLVEAESWSEAPLKVRAVKSLLLDVEAKWDGREKAFRPLAA